MLSAGVVTFHRWLETLVVPAGGATSQAFPNLAERGGFELEPPLLFRYRRFPVEQYIYRRTTVFWKGGVTVSSPVRDWPWAYSWPTREIHGQFKPKESHEKSKFIRIRKSLCASWRRRIRAFRHHSLSPGSSR